MTGDEFFWPGVSIYVKSDYLSYFFLSVHPKIDVPYVLVTASSDFTTPIDPRAHQWDEWGDLTELPQLKVCLKCANLSSEQIKSNFIFCKSKCFLTSSPVHLGTREIQIYPPLHQRCAIRS